MTYGKPFEFDFNIEQEEQDQQQKNKKDISSIIDDMFFNN